MNVIKSHTFAAFLFLLLFKVNEIHAQDITSKLGKVEMSVSIDSISNKLRMNYIFPEMVDKMVESLQTNLKNGKYDSLTDPSSFAGQLTKDLQALSKDKHLIVNYNPAIIARENALTAEDRANEEAEWNKELIGMLKWDNFGIREVKILEGNIGYLDLREFVHPKYGGESISAAMQLLSNTDAMIIDLRQNDGGSPWMVQFLASYFFGSEPVHLADHYNRPKDELTQSWTLPYLPGERRPEVDLYILTSSKSFSAAEGFSYQLQHLKRATIIGEKTAGGAHLTGSVIATDKFFVRIPQGRTISPVTNGDWEGVGVIPNIEVSADQALTTAHTAALEKSKKKSN
jgi:hypothetical protein